MSAADRPEDGGPWWVTSAAWSGTRAVIKFKMTAAGYPDHIRVIGIDGNRPPSPSLLRRQVIAAARRYCEQHRDTIRAALDLSSGDARGIYADAAAAERSPLP